jgi:hypothetical protein
MIPNSLILLFCVIAFFPSTFAYFFAWPRRRLVNVYFPVMGGAGALMAITLALSILQVHVVWLSWVLLALAITCMVSSIILLRTALGILAARERGVAARRAKGG